MDPGTNDPEELQEDIDRNIDKILSVFNENRIDLSKLTQQETDLLLHLIIGITDNFDDDNAEIDNQIVKAYAQAYLRYKDTHNSSMLEIEHLKSEIENINSLIEAIESGEDDVYENDDDKEEAVQMYMNQIENIKKILNIFIAEKSLMVSKMSFLPKEKYPGRGQQITSTNRGLLPDPLFAHVMGYHVGPEYKNISSHPHSHPILGSDLNTSSSSSSSKKGGRRRRKTIKRKTMRRRK